MTQTSACTCYETTLPRGVRAVRIENDQLAATVLVDKGADIYELISKRYGIDVLWKSPWGLRRPAGGTPSAFDSLVSWVEAYEGGWQEIFPSGGGPCIYKGVELNFHGEASMLAWDYELANERDAAGLRLSVRLARSPFRLERTMRVEANQPVLRLRERITNDGGEPVDYMWGHHPALGAPFLGAACRIDTNARTLIADDVYDNPVSPVRPGHRYAWPDVERDGTHADLSRVPGPDQPATILAYFTDYDGEAAWYSVTNTELGFGVGMVWTVAAFPHAWFWQEMHASPGYPWYKGVYVMAIEPSTSYPGQGLVNVMEKTGLHRTLEPGASAEAELRAVFYESSSGISAIDLDGRVTTSE
jgi:galactose mutarotase-like enzyme